MAHRPRRDREIHTRSWLKSFIWRIMGVIVLAAVTYFYTGNWIQTAWITVFHHSVFLIVFYLHERLWLFVDFENLLLISILKCITYETILGTLILGIISLIITGSVQQMTKITLTYIIIKHLMYIWNEFIWAKVKWGRRA